MNKFNYICEACGKEELLTVQKSYDQGWDYPPVMGAWQVVSPRTCGDCNISKTVWWALVIDKTPVEELTEAQQATLQRIAAEVPIDPKEYAGDFVG